jgi:hypothetical protein
MGKFFVHEYFVGHFIIPTECGGYEYVLSCLILVTRWIIR